ncbi:MAG: Calcineurin-like phosphoesterase superfamily domain protein [Gemmatimonadetes bacterium]|nr:Calcineurin-like phosphoesterase superfamily domain protein [Gemmatimonadota bacterium]
MRLVHLSDLHLGYRQYQRLTPGGVNQREADVATTFRTSIDRVIALAPELVVIAGDVFHSVRPTNQAILHAFMQFARLVRALPNTEIVLVAGNHDTPRSTETGGILQLFAQLGLHVVDREARLINFPKWDLSVLAVPDVHGGRPKLQPDPNARLNVMVIHGEVEGVLPANIAASERAALEISHEELGASRWDYVALGHYHVYREVAPNAFYSGSIDYTSANTWGELHEERVATLAGKGLIERDLATGAHTFHPLPASRALIDLPPVVARGLTVAEIDERIRSAVEACAGGIDDKIIRLLVRDVPRHLPRELDHKAIREYKRRALNFQLDFRAPEALRLHATGAPGRRPSLNEVVREKLLTRPLDADVDRAALVARAMAYLDEAQTLNVAPSAVLEV